MPEGNMQFLSEMQEEECWPTSGYHRSSWHSCSFCVHSASRAHLGDELVAAPPNIIAVNVLLRELYLFNISCLLGLSVPF